jgi:nitroreductase
MPVDLILHQDTYRDPPAEAIAAYDATMADYYASRSATRKLGDWTTTTAAAVQGKTREHMLAFLHRQGLFRR